MKPERETIILELADDAIDHERPLSVRVRAVLRRALKIERVRCIAWHESHQVRIVAVSREASK